jgi:hypothetical protein
MESLRAEHGLKATILYNREELWSRVQPHLHATSV